MRGKKAVWQKKIARERIEILFGMAEKFVRKDPELSRRYISLAKRIGMRYLVRIPKRLKVKVCKYCGGYLAPGVSASVRIDARSGVAKITCLNCGRVVKRRIKTIKKMTDGKE